MFKKTIKSVNFLVYNISNEIVEKNLLKQKNAFNTYKSKSEPIIKKIKKLYQSGSLKYYHSDTNFKNVVDPIIMEKTGNDFNFWLNQMSSTIFDFIDHVTNLIRDDNSTDMINIFDVKESLNRFIKNFPDSYDRKRQFVQQGPQRVNLNQKSDYIISEWYIGLDRGVEINDDVIENLDKLISSINLLNNHLLKIREKVTSSSYKELALDNPKEMAKSFEIEFMITNHMSKVIKEINTFLMVRFSNYLEALKLIEKDIKG